MKVLVVYAHPVATSFVAAVRDTAVQAIEAGGHSVEVLDLYAEGFEPRLSDDERGHHLDPPPTRPLVTPWAEQLGRAEAVVLVYPTWWSGPPAIMKGWLDRVWGNGIAFELPEGANRIRGLLQHVRHLVVLTTHGSPKRVNVIEGEVGKRLVGRTLRGLCGWRCRFHWVALYGVDTSTDYQRAAYLRKVEARLSKALR
ncbi:MAG TPA: NAD(P)H-dependent oxidoreductase [Acidimicrobiales bacterium]